MQTFFESPLSSVLSRDYLNPKSDGKHYQSFTLRNFREIPQISRLSSEQIEAIEVVGSVFPFKTNNYVVDELIDWDNVPNDPVFILNFPQKEMLAPDQYEIIADLLREKAGKDEIDQAAMKIRWELNPHPARQESNIPVHKGSKLKGSQHKYRETILFFPSQGQTCHAYCTFCFRWPQFVGMNDIKFAMRETRLLINYIQDHPEITDLIFTGGDPMVMSTKLFATYINPILKAKIKHLKTIRIGTKALSYCPYRFFSDNDSEELLDLFNKITRSGLHLSIMAHFNHPREMETDAVKDAIGRIKETRAEIRTQSPLLKHINDQPEVWAKMWQAQVELGCIPYYMFIARDTGTHQYFGVDLEEAWNVFRGAYQKVSGLARTVRGPSMSAYPGKIQVLGVAEVCGEKVFVLQFLQGKNPDWVGKPFFAQYDKNAKWLNELQPAFNEDCFFFEKNH
ncbi:MAG: lysine 2,3-aminomutase [Desulfobacteraceae bacterium]|jgi:KamA family protein|nr:lysine 2,3-aminomutase [Desulfobacteraceae bacterium]